MIKRNNPSTKQRLLKKNSDDGTLQYPQFEIEECYSVVDYDSRDHSYYYLENEQTLNPVFVELTEKQP